MVEASHGPTDAEKHLQPAVGLRLSPIRHTLLLLEKTTDGRHLFLHETILTPDSYPQSSIPQYLIRILIRPNFTCRVFI